jgi:CBS domain-containing protein
MRVSEVMTRDVCITRPDHTIEDAARMMLAIDAGLLSMGDDRDKRLARQAAGRHPVAGRPRPC